MNGKMFELIYITI